jgi:hypothetical protein
MVTGTFGILEDSRLEDWEAALSTVGRVRRAWLAVQAAAPTLIAPLLGGKMGALAQAVRRHQADRTAQLAIDVARLALDVELRYRPASAIDVERFHLWAQQLRVHAAAGDVAGVSGDAATLEWVRDRITAALDRSERQRLDSGLRALRIAVDVRNLAAAADEAARLAARVRDVAHTSAAG